MLRCDAESSSRKSRRRAALPEYSLAISESKFGSELQQAGCRRTDELAKVGVIHFSFTAPAPIANDRTDAMTIAIRRGLPESDISKVKTGASRRRVHSEGNLDGELHQPRRCGLHQLSEQGAGNISVDGLRAEELCMVEDVERFEPKLKQH